MKTIEQFINSFNKSWTNGDLETFKNLLHKEVVFMSPDFKTTLNGDENCTSSIKEFNKIAQTNVFKVTDTQIHIWDDTANIIMDYYIEYSINDQLNKENGKECWTLKKDEEKWKLLWRALIQNNPIK